MDDWLFIGNFTSTIIAIFPSQDPIGYYCIIKTIYQTILKTWLWCSSVYNKLSSFVSYLQGSFLLDRNTPTTSWFEMSNTIVDIDCVKFVYENKKNLKLLLLFKI